MTAVLPPQGKASLGPHCSGPRLRLVGAVGDITWPIVRYVDQHPPPPACKLTWKPYFKEVLDWFFRNVNWSWSLELNSEMGIASSSTSYGCSVSLSSSIGITRKPAGNVNCLPLPRCAELETLRVELSNAVLTSPPAGSGAAEVWEPLAAGADEGKH